jgi:RimJ/RimL family protein N-acetyltransferase
MNGEIKVVDNNPLYWEFIRELRNNLKTKEGFVEQHHIDQKTHTNFMAKNGDNYMIGLYNNDPAGFVGSVNGDIRVATHPDYIRSGLATQMLNAVMEKLPNSYAKIKIQNEASIRLFERCGFKKKYYVLEKDQE